MSVDIGTYHVWGFQPTVCCRRRLDCVEKIQLFSCYVVMSHFIFCCNSPMMMFSKFRDRIALGETQLPYRKCWALRRVGSVLCVCIQCELTVLDH